MTPGRTLVVCDLDGTLLRTDATLSDFARDGLDRLVVCGDHLDDLPMSAVANRTIAPANGHADVLRHASVVVTGNDEDGVVRHLPAEHLEGAVSC